MNIKEILMENLKEAEQLREEKLHSLSRKYADKQRIDNIIESDEAYIKELEERINVLKRELKNNEKKR